MSDHELDALREAARFSPDNLPLRRHLANQLLAARRFAEAEAEYQGALLLVPGDPDILLGLAESFVGQRKYGAALVALEPLLATPSHPPKVGMTAAWALLGEGDTDAATERYQHAVTRDPALADADLAAQLGLGIGKAGAASAATPADGSAAAPDAGSAGTVADAGAGTPPPSPVAPSGPPAPAPRPAEPAQPQPAYGPSPDSGAPGTGSPEPALEHSAVTFADVAGMAEVKEALRMKLLLPLQQPELFQAFGKRAGGGVLLYGAPGCGKTHLARATAGELGASFIDVGLADILEMWVGSSERNLRATFEMARRNRPCILFFDEVDALAARRSDMRQAHNRQIVNQFLAELDGVDEKANEGVLVLAATNAPWYIDAAFRRPGRFDQMVFVPPPDTAARSAILSILCRDKPADGLDFTQVAHATEAFVGADLKGVVDRAVEAKLHQSLRAGHPVPLVTWDLMAAAQTMRPTVLREWLATARNYVLHSNESGVWDELLPWLRELR